MAVVLRELGVEFTGPEPMSDDAMDDPVVHQAAGMISVQADCTVGEALELLRDRALVSGQSVYEVAIDTVERRARFGPGA